MLVKANVLILKRVPHVAPETKRESTNSMNALSAGRSTKLRGWATFGIQTNGAVANWLIQDERVLTSKGCTAMMHRAVYERLRSWTTLNRDRRSLNGQRPDYEAPGNLGQEVLRPR
ncbi:hypothetical protein K438DRAFT_1782292 [Mycena galopus ATCC 62051]|nr:hypothetical protein K438DRAFT_1782292 [Mycena galopus ATCC 62051]